LRRTSAKGLEPLKPVKAVIDREGPCQDEAPRRRALDDLADDVEEAGIS
jgi:hypothetical protein